MKIMHSPMILPNKSFGTVRDWRQREEVVWNTEVGIIYVFKQANVNKELLQPKYIWKTRMFVIKFSLSQ